MLLNLGILSSNYKSLIARVWKECSPPTEISISYSKLNIKSAKITAHSLYSHAHPVCRIIVKLLKIITTHERTDLIFYSFAISFEIVIASGFENCNLGRRVASIQGRGVLSLTLNRLYFHAIPFPTHFEKKCFVSWYCVKKNESWRESRWGSCI